MKSAAFGIASIILLGLTMAEISHAQPPEDQNLVEWEERWRISGAEIENTLKAWREVSRFKPELYLSDFEVTYDDRTDNSIYITFYRSMSIVDDTKRGQVVVKDNSEIYGVSLKNGEAKLTYTGD